MVKKYISHVERSTTQGFKPLTLDQFAALAELIHGVPLCWDKV